MREIIIKHDSAINIAFGSGRMEKSWRNKPTLWSDFVKRVNTTHRTAEKYTEYMAFTKTRQDEIKDVGGYVGGYLTGGRRQKDKVLNRQLLTLDVDFASAGFWDDFQMMYGDIAAAMYTTHKHSPVKPRIRLLIPLNREVMADEYEPIARRVAGVMGVDFFDPSTFQVHRLMYWPSTSSDGAFDFNYQDGPWLDADATLASYRNWRDCSEWPVHAGTANMVKSQILKQGDPLEKPGIVGAFCRTYDIHTAIELFLPDEYEPCDIEGRYTYKHGSTTAGLITYGDVFAYSHHGTDPTGGKLCNAFDLVRLHKFMLRDEDSREDTPVNRLPSFISMQELAMKDDKVKKTVGVERLAGARADFEGVDFDSLEPAPEGNDDWLVEMDVDKRGNYQSTINNLVLIIENDKYLKGCIAYDDFEKRPVTLKNFPWRKITQKTRYLTDLDDANLAHYLEKTYGIAVTKLDTALGVMYEKHKFHPVRQYLENLRWDGMGRIDTLFIDYLGAENSEYVQTVSRKALVAAVARVMQPGIKFDYVLTFVGTEGLKKSSMIDKLGRQWFSDSFLTVKGKEAFEQLQGVWLVEMAELSALKHAEVEAVKHFVSKREDRYRVAYGKRLENFPRQCIFFGTTNKSDFLKGVNGDRKFWPVQCVKAQRKKEVFKDLTDYEIGQVWAEAMEKYNEGEDLYLQPDMEEKAAEIQKEHSEFDERTGLIQRYLDTLLPEDWDNRDVYSRREFLNGEGLQATGTIQRGRVCIGEIWTEILAGKQADMGTHNTKFIHDIMRTMPGWAPYKSKSNFNGWGTVRGYYRITVKTPKNSQK